MTNRALDLPFTALYERVMEQVKEGSTEPEVRNKYRRILNQVYQVDVPNDFEWQHQRASSTISLTAEYTTGTVAVTAGTTTVTGTSTVWTAGMTGRKIRFSGNDEIYDFTYVGATSGTISPALTGSTDLSGASYAIFQDVYSLASDYGWPTKEPGFYYNVSQGQQGIDHISETDWKRYYTATGADFANYWREYPGRTSLGLYRMQLTPYPTTARILNYEYYKLMDELREWTTGTCTVALNATSVTTSADYSANISAGMYFRLNSSSAKIWRKITAVSTTTLTLDNAYPVAGAAGSAYTVCDGIDMPQHFENILFYGACMLASMEQGDGGGQYAALYRNEVLKARSKSNRRRGPQKVRYSF